VILDPTGSKWTPLSYTSTDPWALNPRGIFLECNNFLDDFNN